MHRIFVEVVIAIGKTAELEDENVLPQCQLASSATALLARCTYIHAFMEAFGTFLRSPTHLEDVLSAVQHALVFELEEAFGGFSVQVCRAGLVLEGNDVRDGHIFNAETR